MKKPLLAAFAAAAPAMLLAAFAPAAYADTGTVTVDGSVAARCQFTTNTATITIAELANASDLLVTGNVDGQQATLVGWCNGTKSTMTANGASLKNGTSAPTGFSNQVDFTSTATEGAISATDTDSTDGSAGSPSTVGIFTGNITVALSSAATHGGPTEKLVAGDYTGSVLVTLAPAN
jgi:hypothetical protein